MKHGFDSRRQLQFMTCDFCDIDDDDYDVEMVFVPLVGHDGKVMNCCPYCYDDFEDAALRWDENDDA
jgi:hypothetical protein